MRFHPLILPCVLVLALAACSGPERSARPQTATSRTPQEHAIAKALHRIIRPTAILGRKAVDPKDLGLPIYPSAIETETGALTTHSKIETSQIVSMNTKDRFDEVYQWYKARMPAGSEQAHMDSPGGSVASFVLGKRSDPDERSVMITQSGDKTTILLNHSVRRKRS
ncbi:MAG: hypothetical protein DLM53_08460 [Candidatus Eremiobacter antarcticus]|nr:hypothetical protein [Candidatus Eremiobacteraeota bacterium]MBC5809140.1 hypothetical protein [Candidatus Eremiobacteraeota bacterium]PZR61607.1 MAG: hypothetical protein DLM53_08460 [Candidatus Eremiobacter sp. RRmetagenome_bin22]